MNVFSIVLKSLKKRALSTTLTVISVLLGAALVVAVQTLEQETEKSYNQTSVGYDLILAYPGSRMQTFLNTIYHLETSTGVIPIGVYQAALNDPRVAHAFPFYVGDNFRGHRIVGTNRAFLTDAQPRAGENFQIREGRKFEAPFEAVIGYETAQRTGLQLGDTFYFTHGIAEPDAGAEPHVHDDQRVEVVGILDRTFTANDRVIFTSIYTSYVVHSHDHDHDHHHDNNHEHHNHDHDHNGNDEAHSPQQPSLEELEMRVNQLDAVMLKMSNPATAVNLAGMLNYPVPDNPVFLQRLRQDPFFAYKDDLMAVIPAQQIQELMSIVGNAEQVLRFIAILVLLVALTGVLVAIYNTMEERRRDIAVMRSLGARKATVFTLILLEAGTITVIGYALGLLAGIGIVAAVAPAVAEMAGVVITPGFNPEQLKILSLFVILGILSGIIPALKAYRTDVASNLNP